MSRTVVVTGCSSGFGRQVSERLARDGDRVYATMRAIESKNAGVAGELRTLAQSEGIDLRPIELDVMSDPSVAAAARTVLDESGAPDVVINNAGQMYVGFTEAFTTEELATQLDINVLGVHRVCRAFLPAMRAGGAGLLMNISSVAGRIGIPFFGVYHASKWALEGYSEALRTELAFTGVDVVLVEPGPFTTSLFGSSPNPADAEGRVATYPEESSRQFDALGATFEGAFNDPDAPTDPRIVVDRMIELINMSPGSRPMRSVLGLDFGVAQMNDAIEPFQKGAIEALGMTSFATLAT